MNYPDASVVDDQKEKESDWLLNKHLLNENVLNLYLLSPLWDSGYHITTLLINKAVQNEPIITWVVEWIIFLVKRAGKINSPVLTSDEVKRACFGQRLEYALDRFWAEGINGRAETQHLTSFTCYTCYTAGNQPRTPLLLPLLK